jgi:hypothetical protein
LRRHFRQLTDQLKISRFALQADKTTDAINEAHLVNYVLSVSDGKSYREGPFVLQTY